MKEKVIYKNRFEEAESTKITKKAFTQIYNSGDLGLVQGLIKGDIKKIISLVEKLGEDKVNSFNLIKTSSMNLDSQGESGKVTTVYKFELFGKIFYGIEDIIDNSKDSNVSWDTVDEYVTLYMVK